MTSKLQCITAHAIIRHSLSLIANTVRFLESDDSLPGLCFHATVKDFISQAPWWCHVRTRTLKSIKAYYWDYKGAPCMLTNADQ